MRSTKAILAALLLGILSIGLTMANENYTDPYILKSEAKEELIAFVNEAKDLVLAEGKDKALQAFNDPKGKFVRGELYISAHSLNGTLLASPYRPETIGQNVLNWTDPNGVAYVRNIREMADRGGGFTYYIKSNPAHFNAEELKLAYAVKVEHLYLSSGIYLPGPSSVFTKEARENLRAFVEEARDFALNNTKDEALKALSDPKESS